MKPSTCLLLDVNPAGDPLLAPAFDGIVAETGYVPLVLTMRERHALTAVIRSVTQDDAHRIEKDGSELTLSLWLFAARAANKLASDLASVKPFMQHARLLTCDEAVDLVSLGAPCVDIDLGNDRVLYVLRHDVATTLYELRAVTNPVDAEAAARRMTSHMDEHEGEPKRPVDIAEADRLFREAFPDFDETLRGLGDRLDGLSECIDSYRKPALSKVPSKPVSDLSRGAEMLGINDLRRRYENYRG